MNVMVNKKASKMLFEKMKLFTQMHVTESSVVLHQADSMKGPLQ